MKILDSVVVSTMVSETRVFTCYEFPEWMRLFWLLWAVVPTATASIITVFRGLQVDFIVGLMFLCGPFVPVGVMATG